MTCHRQAVLVGIRLKLSPASGVQTSGPALHPSTMLVSKPATRQGSKRPKEEADAPDGPRAV